MKSTKLTAIGNIPAIEISSDDESEAERKNRPLKHARVKSPLHRGHPLPAPYERASPHFSNSVHPAVRTVGPRCSVLSKLKVNRKLNTPNGGIGKRSVPQAIPNPRIARLPNSSRSYIKAEGVAPHDVKLSVNAVTPSTSPAVGSLNSMKLEHSAGQARPSSSISIGDETVSPAIDLNNIQHGNAAATTRSIVESDELFVTQHPTHESSDEITEPGSAKNEDDPSFTNRNNSSPDSDSPQSTPAGLTGHKRDRKDLTRVTRLLFFHAMVIHPTDILCVKDPTVHVRAAGWTAMLKHCRNEVSALQRGMFASFPLRYHVFYNVTNYAISIEGVLHPYSEMTDDEQTRFWTHPDRLTTELIKDILDPLKSVIDIQAVLVHSAWWVYMRGLYIVACKSMWDARIPASEAKDGLPHVDAKMVFDAVGAEAQRGLAGRPGWEEVPVKGDLIAEMKEWMGAARLRPSASR